MNSFAGLLFSIAELLVRLTHQELESPIGKVVKGAQSSYFELLWPPPKLPLN